MQKLKLNKIKSVTLYNKVSFANKNEIMNETSTAFINLS